MTTMITATRITDIDASIDRLKIAMTYCGDSSTNALLTDRMAELIIERGSLLARNVAKADKPAVKPATIAAKPAKVAVEPTNGDLGFGFKADGTPRKKADPVWLRNGKTAVKPAAAPVKAEPVIETPVKTAKPSAKNWAGKTMLSGAGTATPTQQEWLVKNSKITAKGAAKLSMVEASNRRAKLTGKIA